MKRVTSLLAALSVALATSTFGATVIISDNCSVSGGDSTTNGFNLGEGINTGINPPTTRLTGTLATNLHYVRRAAKQESAYSISGNKINITQGAQAGRFTFGNDASTNAFDFASTLGVANATPENPLVYDVAITMNNKCKATNSPGKMSFAFGSTEQAAGNWNFGIQIIPTTNGLYNIFKRIKPLAANLGSDPNAVITNAWTNNTEITFLFRVTDAGTETDTNSLYHSRVQVSMDNGANWFYDTQSDPLLANGWRFDGPGRYFSFDQAANNGADTYDDFSVTLVSPLIWNGSIDANWSNNGNWLRGTTPVSTTPLIADALVFAGTNQQTNGNDITDLNIASLTFSNAGFSASGNAFTLTSAITNALGDNTLNNDIFLGANSRFHSLANNLILNGTINSTGRNLTVSGNGTTIINGTIATGTGNLTKSTTAGTMILNGTNTSTGSTTVSQGLLSVNGSIASPSVTVSAAGILGGTGSLSGTIAVTGSLAAGNGIGKLTTGNLTLNSNGTNIFEISSVTGTAGTEWDLVDAGANNIDVQATSASQFKFKVLATGLSNFDKNSTYSWPAIAGTVLNFSADKFLVVDSAFTNDLAGGAFSVESTGTGLNVRYVNNQAPTASPTNLTFAAGTPFQLPIADLLTNLTSDPDGDARVLVSVISTNAAVTTNATNITIFSANSTTESIAYIVRDARNYKAGDTVRTATNYINIVVTAAPNGGTLTVTRSGNAANLSFTGNPDQVYIIERSQDLATWTGVYTNTAAGNGTIQFSEVPPVTPAFYRARTQ